MALKECIDYAISRNTDILQSTLNIQKSRNLRHQQSLGYLPDLTLLSNFNYNAGKSINPFTNQFELNPVGSQAVSLSTSLTLFNGFQKYYQLMKSHSDISAMLLINEELKLDLTQGVINAFLNILLQEEIQKTSLAKIDLTRAQVERLEIMSRSGRVHEADVLQLQLELLSEENSLKEAEVNKGRALRALTQIMNLDPATNRIEIDFPDTLPSLFNWVETVDSMNLRQRAVDVSPALKRVMQQRASSIYVVKYTKSLSYPTVRLTGNLNTNFSTRAPDSIPVPGNGAERQINTYSNQLRYNLQQGVGISVQVPLMFAVTNRQNVKLAELEVMSYDIEATKIKRAILNSLGDRLDDLHLAVRRLEFQERRFKVLTELLRVATEQNKGGVIHFTEYMNIRNQFTATQYGLLQAKYDYALKLTLLEIYVGRTPQIF
jgi:outer membrane protein